MKKITALAIVTALLLAVVMMVSAASAESDLAVYTGTGMGNNGKITVEVSLANEVIIDVQVKEHSETAGISDAAISGIPAAIIAGNGIDVDTVSGATNSSKGIIAAVKDALIQAGVVSEEAKNPRNTGTKADYEDILPSLMGSENAVAPDAYYPGLTYIAKMFDTWANIAEDYAPEVRTLKNGVKVQRTPSEYGVYAWQISGDSISYNTYFLDADRRGCGACHYDLNETLRNMSFAHPGVWNDALGNQTNVESCQFCHEATHGYCISDYDFGTFIHGLHMGRQAGEKFYGMGGQCISCHNMTSDGMGVTLWDVVKYDKMVGIVKVPEVQGEFAYNQDLVQSADELFTFDWLHSYYDALRRGTGANGLGLDSYPEEIYDEWEITVEGNVAQPYTAKLKDLIAEAEEAGVVVTKVSKIHCTWNSIGGGGIGQTEITGVPVEWLLEKAGGVLPGSTGVNCKRACGGDPERSWSMEHVPNAYMVYKLNGERLDVTHGAPVLNWVEAVDAQSCTRTFDRYVVRSEADNFDYAGGAGTPNGWTDADGNYTNNPNASILGVPEGMIVQTGEPFEFHGYVDAYNEKIASVEFSMDGGKTWTKYDIGDTDVNKLVTWTYTFTPETDGSYVLMVRGTTETGRVSPAPHKAMFTARSDANELD